ncbi:MFS transporter [Mycobacterium sp. NAZ190054]|uniref:MFS transporter n=1 Tax=Mycobacterium sp. NAZ190054 TaxID=1747766 RepID=UPI000A4966F8|nr:MFS transporter [Mycobacterium sp. NAZ190054]
MRSAAPLPRWLWRLLIAMTLTQVAAFLVRPALTYRALELGADDVYVGLLVAIYAFLPALLAVPIGRYTDRHRPGPVFIAGTGLLGIGSAGLAVAPSLATVAAATVVLGLGAMTIMVGAQSIVALMSTEDTLDRDFGLTTAAAAIGQMIGPLGTGWILTGERGPTGTLTAFACGAVLCVLASAFTFGFPDHRRPAPDAPPPQWRETMSILRIPGVPGAMTASMVLLATVDLLVAYLPVIGERAGIGAGVVGILLSLRAAASVGSRVLLGRLARRFSRRRLITASTLVTAVLVPAIAFVSNPWALGGLLVVLGFFLGLGQPLTMTLITTAVPATSRGAALAIRMLGNKAGQVGVPAFIAATTAVVGIGGGFALLGAIVAAATYAASRRHG